MMSYFNIYTLVSLDSNTMHILKDFSRTDNSLYKCLKKYFQVVKNVKEKNAIRAQKCKKKEKKWKHFQNIFLKISKYCHIDPYFFIYFFFSLLKNMI